MNIKGVISNLIPVDFKSRDLRKTRNQPDRDPGQGGQGDGKPPEPHRFTEEELDSALKVLRDLPGVKENNLQFRIERNELRVVVFIEDPSGKVIRRIPDQDLWAMVKNRKVESSRGNLLNKAIVRRTRVGISFGSINTGLPPNIVQQLIEAERQPVKQLEARKGKEQEKQKLVEDLTTKVREIFTGLRELGGTTGFTDMKLETGDNNILVGTADKSIARPGNYQIEVQKLAHKTSALSNGFPDKDESEVGVGYFRIELPNGDEKEIYVDGRHNTLDKLAGLINQNSIGIQASVINDRTDKDNPFHLMLSGKDIGEDGVVQFPTFYFLGGDQDFYIDKERPAENGKVKVDGLEFEINDNKLNDVIPGVTLDLKQAAPGREINVTIKEDKEVIAGKIKKFVDQVNGVFNFIQAQNKLDKESDTSRTLGGDSLLRDVENRLRQALQDPVFGAHGSIKYLSQVGVSFTREGTLQYDEAKFNSTLAKQLGDVTEFFVGDNETYGLATRVKQTLNNLLDSVNGPLPQRSRGIKDRIESFDQQIANKERILSQKEVTLRNQFSRLEETMSKLKSQGQYLAARLGGPDGGANLNLSGGQTT
ncbi:unnamed protein product [Sphagnum balticum]